MDWLERHLNNPEFETVWVGYTSFNRKRVTTSNYGIWLGYKGGELFTEMRFRQTVPKEKFGQDVWTHAKSLVTLFDKMHPYISSPPLVLINSRKAIKFLYDGDYKWKSIEYKEKSKIHFWMDTMTPKLEWYNVLERPFCILRELMLEEGENVSRKIANREFFDWTELNES
jgi:hypothetical protein